MGGNTCTHKGMHRAPIHTTHCSWLQNVIRPLIHCLPASFQVILSPLHCCELWPKDLHKSPTVLVASANVSRKSPSNISPMLLLTSTKSEE